MSYENLREKYAISDEEMSIFKTVQRKRAFEDLDAEIEAYKINHKQDNNNGKMLDPTDEEVERILDEYIDRRYQDFAVSDEMDDMRDAIQTVTGLIC